MQDGHPNRLETLTQRDREVLRMITQHLPQLSAYRSSSALPDNGDAASDLPLDDHNMAVPRTDS
jgi:hypothetical protein